MLIASKIVEQNPASYDVLCLSYNENEKYDYYFNRLSLVCENSYRFVVYSENKIYRIFDFARFKFYLFKILKNKYSKIYLASIDNPFVHMLLSYVHGQSIVTFDDGSANIYSESNYYKYVEKNKIQSFILEILGNNYNISKVINESTFHYTIYEGHNNIVEEVRFLPMFLDIKTKKNSGVMKIFLGQPLDELKGGNSNKIISFLKNLNIQNYFPHPRESLIYKDFNYIKTPLIFEDYILKLLEEGYQVDVYTVLSTAALNVASLENVNVNVLYEEDLGLHYEKFYHLFNALNCNILIVH
ncbi:CMP-N-acetylneuraminate-beta-galactosamide-alpha-2,3-sialyltransferase [compost metagenome]